MKINSQNSRIKAHYYATKERYWRQCSQGTPSAKNHKFWWGKMRGMVAKRGRVVAVFFGWYSSPAHYLDVRAIRWLNS